LCATLLPCKNVLHEGLCPLNCLSVFHPCKSLLELGKEFLQSLLCCLEQFFRVVHRCLRYMFVRVVSI
jgi:hypothetical protein